MEDEYNESGHHLQQGHHLHQGHQESPGSEDVGDDMKEEGEEGGRMEDGYGEEYCEEYDEDFRGQSRGRGNFRFPNRGRGRGNGPPPGWMGGPPRFRGRGYGPGGPPPRGPGGGPPRGPTGPPPFFPPPRGPPPGHHGPPPGHPMHGGPPRHMSGPPPNAQRFGPDQGPWGPPGMMGGPGPYGPPMMGGPPPHMMGPGGPNGPPFMGPPPPNMPVPELWVETKTEEGKSYFYHARTRETTWTRPQEGPMCKVITQGEVEAMAQQNQQGPMGQMGPNGPMGPMGGPMGPMMGPMGPNGPMVPNGPMGSNMGPNGPMGPMGHMGPMGPMGGPGMMGGFMPNQGPPGNAMGGMNQKMDDKPPGARPDDPGASKQMGQPEDVPGDKNEGEESPGQFTHTNTINNGSVPSNKPNAMENSGLAPPQQQFSLPPPGFPWAPPGQWPAQPPQWQPPSQQPPPLGPPQEMVDASAEWTSHRAPDGRTYYYNAKKQESVWEKPQPMKDLEAFQQKMASGSMAPQPVGGPPPVSQSAVPAAQPNLQPTSTPVPMQMDAYTATQVPGEVEMKLMPPQSGNVSSEPEKVTETDKAESQNIIEHSAEESKQAAEKEQQAKQQDKSRPVSSTPISGTPWCVVWTGDGRVFFYNPTAHSSVWERPEQLAGRADVDRAVSNPPEVLANNQVAVATAASQSTTISNAAAAANVATQGTKRPAPPSNSVTNNSAPSGAASDSEEDSEPEAKKGRTETNGTVPDKKPLTTGPANIDIGKEAAIEAEVRAARERATVPLDLRVKRFREMLVEKEVSAFSTWEKELHKIVFDHRYLLLTSKERKQVFDKYVRERVEEERKEKKNRMKQRKEDFRALMEEAKVHGKSSFADFATKYGKEDRYKGIERLRDREGLFNEFVVEMRKREKEEKAVKREQSKKDFFTMLSESSEVDRHSHWLDVKKKFESDPRYKAVDGSAMREDYFRDYIKVLKEERRREKEKDRDSRSTKKEKKDKDRDRERDRDRDREDKEGRKSKGKDKKEERVDSEDQADGSEDDEATKERLAKEKAARAEASIKEREREVQKALASSLRDRDKEREYHKRDEAVQHFNALLADLVRNPDLGWREAKKQLKKDHRWPLADLISKEEKERLFTVHTGNLSMKRRDKFREMLDELAPSRLTLTSSWKDIKKLIKEDPRYLKYSNSDKCEREFRDYIKDKTTAAKQQLRALFLETRALTHKSLTATRDNVAHLNELEQLLSQDARYIVLDHLAEERTQGLVSYLEELDKRGPPPPPTASEPTRRGKM